MAEIVKSVDCRVQVVSVVHVLERKWLEDADHLSVGVAAYGGGEGVVCRGEERDRGREERLEGRAIKPGLGIDSADALVLPWQS